jgi:myo-inositol-1(or 4)-monophosphatase
MRVQPPRQRRARHGVRGGRPLRGYFEPHINAWDVTAGIVIVREAGGFTNDFFAGERRLERGNAILAGAPGCARSSRTRSAT